MTKEGLSRIYEYISLQVNKSFSATDAVHRKRQRIYDMEVEEEEDEDENFNSSGTC